jgi:arsenate reductase-like glutaredoxin family protein
MKHSNESVEHPRRLYVPLPELEDAQGLAMAAEVDALLLFAREEGYITSKQWQQAGEQRGGKADPASSLEGKKHLLAALLREQKLEQLPQACFAPLMQMAVYEANPSFNRSFIEPCLRAFGYRSVLEALLDYVEHGTNREKAGAARALYWAQLPLLLPSWYDRARPGPNQETLEQALQAFHEEVETAQRTFDQLWQELGSLRTRIAHALLKEFVENANLDVRRSILPQLALRPGRYPAEWEPLVLTAIRLARTHGDAYIRHRVELQLQAEDDPQQ